MANKRVVTPFPVFTDTNGSLLEDGNVYIGEKNLNPKVNSIPVFFDSGCTIPAAQPIKTIAGYPIRNGSPTNVYTNTDYSMSVEDKNDEFLYSILNSQETQLINSFFTLATDFGDGSRTRATLEAAFTDIGSVPTFLLLTGGDWDIDGGLIIPDNITLYYDAVSALDIDTGFIVQFDGKLSQNTNHQVFKGDGDVEFTNGTFNISILWFGADPTFTIDSTVAIQKALNSLSTTGASPGGIIFVPQGTFKVNASMEIPEKCGILGVNASCSRIKPDPTAVITGGIFTNATKTGSGQEFLFIEKINIDGNKDGGAVVDTNVLLENVYVNSYIKDCVIQNASGTGLQVLATNTAASNGPIDIINCWVNRCDGGNVRLRGLSTTLNFIGGAYENAGAGTNIFDIEGDATGRSYVNISYCGIEYSNLNVIGIRAERCHLNVRGVVFDGSQDATQTNILIDNTTFTTNYSIQDVRQSIGVRTGIRDDAEDIEINTSPFGIFTNEDVQFLGDIRQMNLGDFTNPDQQFTDGDTAPSVKGWNLFSTNNTSPTEIDRFTDCGEGQLIIVEVRDNNTRFVRNNTFLQLQTDGFNAQQDDIIVFLCRGAIAREVSRSKNHISNDNVVSRIIEDSATPTLNAGGPGTSNVFKLEQPNPINVTRFLNPGASIISFLCVNGNTTFEHGTFFRNPGGTDIIGTANDIVTYAFTSSIGYHVSTSVNT